MFRTLYWTLLGVDRTRVLERALGRFRKPFHAALLVYALVFAIVGSARFVSLQDPDGWWPALFASVFLPYVLLIWSPLYAWRVAALALYPVASLISWTGVADFQYWTLLPLVAGVAAFYSGGVTLTATVLTMAVVGFSESQHHDAIMAVPVITGVIYLFGARGRVERELEEQRGEKAALEERARIAREMHDVVAHHMSMVVVRCETAPYRLPGLNEAAQKEFEEVGQAAREAITDMQRLLGVLRANGETPAKEPQPGISRIPELARPGDEAEVDVDDVPEAVGLTAYRIVQEALTNATRHAPGSKASVHVHKRDGQLDVLVRNTAGGPSRGGGSGQGLIGMHERVAVHGGTLTVKSTEDGGFLVRARIPLGDK
ncbi:histidine kinase [Lentzea sp. NPDC042327]|uniref:sensor histidine kinase n=1 Tax=Lentzea sp. NPDC042327 TaxID=3154801 RepID=UPI003404E2A2